MRHSAISLRDPAGTVLQIGGRVLRVVLEEGDANAATFLASRAVRRHIASGTCIGTRELARSEWPIFPGVETASRVLDHEPIAFPSFPVEWTPGMLHAAGMLTLDLASELLAEDATLKDATPLNVLYRHATPVFVDALSLERRDLRAPFWFAYGQFIRTFVLPLLASKELRWSLRQSFTGARDGISPEKMFSRLGWLARLRQPALGTVTGPVFLSKLGGSSFRLSATQAETDPGRARFVLDRVYQQLRRSLDAAMPRQEISEWTGYTDPAVHPPEYHSIRQRLVASVLQQFRPRHVLDIGTNDGTFALLSSEAGADVVAIDRDEAVMERTFRRVVSARANVLPLVVDITDPTPSTGWGNVERASFLERSAGHFDAVLCLAVLHHLVVGDGLALGAVVDLLADLTEDLLVAEFVPADDPCCQRLARGRPVTAARWSEAAFEAMLQRKFTVVVCHTEGLRGRSLYVLRRRA